MRLLSHMTLRSGGARVSGRRGERIILGAMSGTSADGVDVAVVRVTGRGIGMGCRLVAMATVPFAQGLRRRIVGIRNSGKCELAELAAVGREITLTYAKASHRAISRARVEAEEVACIAAHGQTLFHAPPLTIQWFDPALLAAETGCVVVSDFRRADCALGGQGAPLVPFADYILFRDRRKSRVLLNIGGIANITYLPAGGTPQQVVAFDTGPGNCLSDWVAQERLGANYDAGGRVARTGIPDEVLVSTFLKHAYFRRPFPKSTDGPEMVAAFREAAKGRRLSTPDLLASACLCCARAIARSLELLPGGVDEIVAAGGGMKNKLIVRLLGEETKLPRSSTGEFGVPIEAREAMAFALLGAATLDGLPSNVPSVTGASRPAILGSITPVP
jgi:anhydro-N-acetylmuramic acid kinase